MKKIFSVALLFLLAASIYYGCSAKCGCTTYCSMFCEQQFKFVMKDTLDQILVEGIMFFETADDNTFQGKYNFTKVYNNEFAGFSTMKGVFNGQYSTTAKSGTINTNPKIADYNILIDFKILTKQLKGNFYLSTLKGKINGGTFFAELIETK
ncbi:MAG: hypothetical protein ACP5P3_03550 [Ignavibacteria bacterium]